MQVISVKFPKKIVVTVAVTAKHVTSADLTQILLDLDAINGEVVGTTAAEKTDKIEATKLAIETAIETADIDVPAGTVFADYPDYVADAVAKAFNEALFDFKPATKTLLPYCYNSYIGPTAVIIPETIGGTAVEIIAANAFVAGIIDKRQITSVYIPDSVHTIGSAAFDANKLSSVRLPINPSFTVIPVQAFNAASAGNAFLMEIDIPPSVTTIGQYAFAFHPLIKIKLGANVSIFNDASYPTFGAYGAAFESLYNVAKLAGTYEYSGGSWSKTA